MTLLEVQRRMAAAVMLPLTSKDRISRKRLSGLSMAAEATALIKPNSLLSPLERLEIYSRSYWFRLLDSFGEDFSGLAAMLGARAFERLARRYLTDCPSGSFTLRDLGSGLESWLAQHREFGGRNPDMALDMVRLEWAHIVAFDGPAEKMLGPEDLMELRPDLRIGVQPHIGLLELHYAVDEFRVRTYAAPEEPAATSNVPTDRTRRSRSSHALPSRQQLFIAVHRLDLSVYYRRMSREEFRLLCALRAGRSISAAIDSAFDGSSAPTDQIPELLRCWFSSWAQLGWLTPGTSLKEGFHE